MFFPSRYTSASSHPPKEYPSITDIVSPTAKISSVSETSYITWFEPVVEVLKGRSAFIEIRYNPPKQSSITATSIIRSTILFLMTLNIQKTMFLLLNPSAEGESETRCR